MYFLFTLIAAILATVIWFKCEKRSQLKLGALCLIYWGATLMWAVDLFIAGVVEGEGIGAFETGTSATILGILVVVLAIVIWGLIFAVSKFKRTRKANF